MRDTLLVVRAECEAAERVVASPGFADRVLSNLVHEIVSPWLEVLPLVRAFAATALAVLIVSVSLLWLRPGSFAHAPDLPMGQLDRVTEQLFLTGSVPLELLPPPRAAGEARREHR